MKEQKEKHQKLEEKKKDRKSKGVVKPGKQD